MTLEKTNSLPFIDLDTAVSFLVAKRVVEKAAFADFFQKWEMDGDEAVATDIHSMGRILVIRNPNVEHPRVVTSMSGARKLGVSVSSGVATNNQVAVVISGQTYVTTRETVCCAAGIASASDSASARAWMLRCVSMNT